MSSRRSNRLSTWFQRWLLITGFRSPMRSSISAGSIVLFAIRALRRLHYCVRRSTPLRPARSLHLCSRRKDCAVAGARPGRDILPLSETADSDFLRQAQAASWRGSCHWKVVPSRHIRCRMTASLRATATVARLFPSRSRKACPQSLSVQGREQRCSRTPAAS